MTLLLCVVGKLGLMLKEVCKNALKKIYCWTFENKLSLNIAKTKFMTFGSYIDSIPINISISVNGQPIERVNSFKYLGATFDFNTKFETHVCNITKRLRYLLYVLSRLRSILSLNQLLTIYYGLFHSIATYGIIV